MKILISGLMGPGTLQAKTDPLCAIEDIDKIIFVRKNPGPLHPKIKYIVLPSLTNIPLFNILITPFYIIKQCSKHRPKVIIGYHILPYAFFVAIAGYLTKTPYIVAQTGLSIEKTVKNNLFLKIALYQIFKKSIQVNCPGKHSQKHWQGLFPKISKKFKILHSTVNTLQFAPDNTIPKEYTFVFLGRLAPVKNIDLIISGFHVFLKTINDNQKHHLIIVGKGPEKERLQLLVNSLKLDNRISFTGFVNNPEIYLKKSRFLVMASKTEGLPTAMMQAMSCEVIPITNLTGNIGDIVTHNETGFTFQGCNSDEIARALTGAITAEKNDTERIKKNCRQLIINRHSHESASRQWNQILKSIYQKHI